MMTTSSSSSRQGDGGGGNCCCGGCGDNHHHNHNLLLTNTMESSPKEEENNNAILQQQHSINHENNINNERGGDDDDDDDVTATTTTTTTVLATLLKASDWTGALARIVSHPHEARIVCGSDENRTALHVACHEDAPAVVIGALVQAYPEASCMVGTSHMTPLHITCSSPHASVQVVRVLYELGRNRGGAGGGGVLNQFQMRDVDGDTALHAACRCGARMEVLQLLLQANPAAVHERDCEGLTPLLRLWVRYFVILGKNVIESAAVQSVADFLEIDDNNSNTTTTAQGGGGQLAEAWSKTKLLLFCAHHGSLLNYDQQQDNNTNTFSTILHAAAAVDCPRQVVRIAALTTTVVHNSHNSRRSSLLLCQQQQHQRDANGLTPLHIACLAPIFKVRDLSDEGYTMMEDQIHDYNNNNNETTTATTTTLDTAVIMHPLQEQQQHQQPSVIEILLQAAATKARQEEASSSSSAASACICMMTDPLGRLPLHLALSTGKRWHVDGVKQLVEANAKAVSRMDPTCRLYPFMMAAAASAAVTKGNTNNNNGSSDDDDLNTSFELLRCNPTVLSDIITGKKNM